MLAVRVVGLIVAILPLSCGPSVHSGDGDGTTGAANTSGTGGTGDGAAASDGNVPPIPPIDDNPCRPELTCDAWEATAVGECETVGYRWDGFDCSPVTGCECYGVGCCHMTATQEECYDKVRATCDDLPFCLTCAPNEMCLQLCDHVSLYQQSCAEDDPECDEDCECQRRGYDDADCEGTYSSAVVCLQDGVPPESGHSASHVAPARR